jgi:hypothetical protein
MKKKLGIPYDKLLGDGDKKTNNHSKKDYIEIEFIPKLSKKSFIRYLIREVSPVETWKTLDLNPTFCISKKE